jgi:hypothetical protein
VAPLFFSLEHPFARLPNTRLKLSAPVPNRSSGHPGIRCASIPFVNSHTLRRSLSAIR